MSRRTVQTVLRWPGMTSEYAWLAPHAGRRPFLRRRTPGRTGRRWAA